MRRKEKKEGGRVSPFTVFWKKGKLKENRGLGEERRYPYNFLAYWLGLTGWWSDEVSNVVYIRHKNTIGILD